MAAAGPALAAAFPPPPSPPPPDMSNPSIITLNNRITDGQITTNLYLMFAIGCICFLFFIIFRKGIKLYETRLYLANVTVKPPKMKLSGHHRLWSWLVPIFTVTDEEIIRSCGLDSLMLVRMATLGVQFFLPVTILACVTLLPTYTSQNYIAEQHSEGNSASTSTPFTRATMGNVKRSSQLFWIPFVFVYLVIIYASWLLRRHYRSYVQLRQRYIVKGEVSVNEWHETYMRQANRRMSTAKPLAAPKPQRSTWQAMISNWTPPDQIQDYSSDEEDAETWQRERGDSFPDDGAGLRQRQLRRQGSSGGGSPLLRKLASRRLARQSGNRSPSPDLSGEPSLETNGSGDLPSAAALGPGRSPAAAAGTAAGGGHIQHDLAADAGLSPSGASADGRAALTPAQRRGPELQGRPPRTSLLQRNTSHKDDGETEAVELPSPAPTAAREDDRGSVRAASSVAGGSPAPPNILEQMFNKREAEARNASAFGEGRTQSRTSSGAPCLPDVAPGLVRMNDSEAASSESYILPQRPMTSRYETDRQEDEEASSGIVVYKWWQGERDPHGGLLSGKPNVWARKVTNTQTEGGKVVGVMAQQYVVLVEGVPDPATQSRSSWRHSKIGKILDLGRRKKKRSKSGSKSGSPTAPSKRPSSAAIQPIDVPSRHSTLSEEEGGSGGSTPFAAGYNGGVTSSRQASFGDGGKQDAETQAGGNHVAIDIDGPLRSKYGDSGTEGDAEELPSNVAENTKANERAAALAAGQKLPPPDDEAEEHYNEGSVADEEDGGVSTLSREDVVHEFFQYLFPDSFQMALPVLKHQEVDQLLYQWDKAAKALEIVEAQFEASECTTRPKLKLGGFCCCGGTQVDAINHWAAEVRRLEAAVGEARQHALRSQPTSSFFVFFNDQQAATVAAQTSLQSEDGRAFRVSQAPGPEEVNWPTLWEDARTRHVRSVLVWIPIVAMILMPIGIFAGSVSQATLLLCGSQESNNSTGVKWAWYCSGNNYVRKLITGVVPPLVLTFWQGIVVPRWFYYWCQAERKSQSFTQLEGRILDIFFWWSVFSVFLGAMFGGAIFSQFRVALEDPGQIVDIIATALPISANFFINYCVVQALAIMPFRFMFPHMGIFPWVFRACGLCKPATKRIQIDRLWPHSARASKETAFMILIVVIGSAYAAVSPIILPFALLYFLISWAFWRYAVLYFFERCYESGGRLFEHIFSQMVFILFIFEAFTAAALLSASAWAQGSIMLLTLTPYLYQFHKATKLQYGATKYVPLESAAAAPKATVDPAMYIPPALRHGCAGWYPEAGKAWEAWNANVYTI